MLYLERNEDGSIAAIHRTPTEKAAERKTMLDEEVVAFLTESGALDSWAQMLSLSDISIIRVIEDLIDVLVKKNVIMLTDLPEGARKKLNERKKVRDRMEHDHFIVDNII